MTTATAAKPRVLVVTPWFPSVTKPGGGIFVLRDVEMLTQKYSVTVIHASRPEYLQTPAAEELTWDSFRTVRVPTIFTQRITLLRTAALIRRELQNHDVLHTMALEAMHPMLLVPRVKLPWVHTEHWSGVTKPLPGNLRSRLPQQIFRAQLRRPKILVAVSEYLAGYVSEIAPRSRLRVVGNAVMTVENLPANSRKTLLAEAQKPWDFSTLRLLGVGALADAKGPQHAVAAVAALRRAGHNVTLRWAGSGPDLESLKTLASEMGVSEHIRFLGQLDPAAIQAEICAANLFIAPTLYETFGVAIAEAHALGLPVVTGSVGGFKDFLHPAANRQITPQKFSGDSIAEAVLDLVHSPELPRRADIISTATAQFSDERRLEMYSKIYAEAGLERP